MAGSSASVPSGNHLAWWSRKVRGMYQVPVWEPATNRSVLASGTGSTGIQLITTVAPDVAHLVVFQRTPQYSVPAGNGPLSRQRLAYVRENHTEIWHQVRASAIGFGFDESKVAAMSVGEDERREVEPDEPAYSGVRFEDAGDDEFELPFEGASRGNA